jgi:hypothetical protein
LLSAKPHDDYRFFDIACLSLRPQIAIFYCQLKTVNITNHINLRKSLDMARNLAWQHPNLYTFYDKICELLNQKKKNIYPPRRFPENRHLLYFLEGESLSLFNTSYSQLENNTGKAGKIKIVLAEFSAILNNPLICIKYLRFLNKEFKRYYRETYKGKPEFSVDPSTFRLTEINGIKFPIPNDDYPKIKKGSALQSFLVSLFQSVGLAKKCYKWTGFVPEDISNKMIANGDFFKEDRFEAGLFHGTYSHMFQLVILIYAIQSGEIALDYREGDKTHKLTIKDILEAFVSNHILHNKNELPWTKI